MSNSKTIDETRVDRAIVFAGRLARAMDDGEFPEDSEPQAVAYILRTLVSGIESLRKHLKEPK